MMVMPANSTHELVHYWAGLYGGIGHLYTPTRKERKRLHLPFALDNGRYAEAVNNRPFDGDKFLAYVDDYVYRENRPLFVVVPDVPFDGESTLRWWDDWVPRLRAYGIPLALCLQDGMGVDVTDRLMAGDYLFVGGTTEWKWKTVESWCERWPLVHVGRVNTQQDEKLDWLKRIGVTSIDGSGWFRGKAPQVVALGKFLARQSGQCEIWAEKVARMSRHDSQVQGCLPVEATA